MTMLLLTITQIAVRSSIHDKCIYDSYYIVLDVDQLQQYSRFPLPVAKEAILLQVVI